LNSKGGQQGREKGRRGEGREREEGEEREEMKERQKERELISCLTCEYSSVVEHLPYMHEILSLIS
jgi:hypothetical protein